MAEHETMLLLGHLRRCAVPTVEFNNRTPPKSTGGRVLPGFARKPEERPSGTVKGHPEGRRPDAPAERSRERGVDAEFVVFSASAALRLAGRLTATLRQRQGVRTGQEACAAAPEKRKVRFRSAETARPTK